MIVGICGFIGSGKDTIADYLVGFEGYRRDSFAGTLKDAVAAVFGWDRELLEGRTPEARAWREQVDTWWAERLEMPTLTPRWVLQYWGTEVCRRGFHDDIWIAALEARLLRRSDNTVISDVRFPNEIQSIRNSGGKIIWVKRGTLPEWYDLAVQVNAGPRGPYHSGGGGLALAQQRLTEYGVHVSETAWVGTDFDYVIDNNGTIEDLYNQIKQILSELNQESSHPAAKSLDAV
jgi:hypothetical protein